MERPLTDEQIAARRPQVPELKLKPDVVIESLDEDRIVDALRALVRNEVRNVLLKDRSSGHEAVLVPVDRYAMLVGTELASTSMYEVLPVGRVEPQGFQASEVEMADPAASWQMTPGHSA
jgi:hypothetical protein